MKLKVIIPLLHTAKKHTELSCAFAAMQFSALAYLLLADQTQHYKSYLRMRLQMHLNQTKTSYFVAAQAFTSADYLLAYQT